MHYKCSIFSPFLCLTYKTGYVPSQNLVDSPYEQVDWRQIYILKYELAAPHYLIWHSNPRY